MAVFTVLSLAVRVYAGYKAIQLWSRYVSDADAGERFRRQDLRSARTLYRTAVKLEGLLIKACQFIATRADILPDEWVGTLSVLHDRVPPRPFAIIRDQIESEMGHRSARSTRRSMSSRSPQPRWRRCMKPAWVTADDAPSRCSTPVSRRGSTPTCAT